MHSHERLLVIIIIIIIISVITDADIANVRSMSTVSFSVCLYNKIKNNWLYIQFKPSETLINNYIYARQLYGHKSKVKGQSSKGQGHVITVPPKSILVTGTFGRKQRFLNASTESPHEYSTHDKTTSHNNGNCSQCCDVGFKKSTNHLSAFYVIYHAGVDWSQSRPAFKFWRKGFDWLKLNSVVWSDQIQALGGHDSQSAEKYQFNCENV